MHLLFAKMQTQRLCFFDLNDSGSIYQSIGGILSKLGVVSRHLSCRVFLSLFLEFCLLLFEEVVCARQILVNLKQF